MIVVSSFKRALDYGDKGKFRRPSSRLRLGWMFPFLAVLSLFINGSMHTQRMRRSAALIYEIERGPPVTTNPKDRLKIKNESTRKEKAQAKLDEAIQRRAATAKETPSLLVKHEPSVTNVVPVKRRSPTQETKVVKSTNNLQTKEKSKPLPRKVDQRRNSQSAGKRAVDVGSNKKANTKTQKERDSNKGHVETAVGPKFHIETKTESSKAENFSACLLIRDDNDILNEWIAYHYHALRMTRLIVAVDPNSETDPAPLLDVWRDLIEIDVWTDDMYMSEEFLKTKLPPKEDIKNITKFKNITPQEMMEINIHRYRQRYFLSKCFEKLKMERRTWVAHIDTDEYVVPNKFLRAEQEKHVEIKPIQEPGSILDLIQQLVKSDSKDIKYPCITMIRLFFGSVETNEDKAKLSRLSLPSDLDKSKFETLRWRHHGAPLDKKQSGFPKVLLDLSKIPTKYLSNGIIYSIHRPFPSLCRGQGDVDYSAFQKFPISTNHYLGSWERYNARNDKRRSRDIYNAKANVDYGRDSWVEGWLQGFIDNVGQKKALQVLGQHYLKSVQTKTS